MKNVVIVSAARTAIGSFGGSLASVHATELGALATAEILKRVNIPAEEINEVILGNVLQAGLGQNPARQASIKAGLPESVPSVTINAVCGSGLHSVTLATQTIMSGMAKSIVAGGFENMSQAPFATTEKARFGYRMGEQKLTDIMVHDALTCAFNNYHMGITAENIADRYKISREEQDKFALHSQQKAAHAIRNNTFHNEIFPVTAQLKKQNVIFNVDEFPRDTTPEILAKLRPAFSKSGTVTAGNASGINDGAAALLIVEESHAKSLGLPILARIRATGLAGVAPEVMGLGPIPATKKALSQAGLTIQDLDLIEANEAFAAQCLAVKQELNIPEDKLNINGGAIALGHPVGASGARILVSLLYSLQAKNKTLGLATLCIGGGMGSAVIIERV